MNSNTESQSARKFLRVLILSVIGLSLLMVLLNFLTDRYYVFHPRTEPFEEFLEPNTRVLKANYLAQNCSRFDAAIFGSSRAAAIRTHDLDKAFGVTSYNFGVATGSLPGILARLEWLDGMACMPRYVFLPISIDRLRFTERPNDLLRKEHPAIVGQPAYHREFLLSYLGIDAFFSNVRKLLEDLFSQPEPRFRYDPGRGDVDYLWDRDLEFSACPRGAVRTDNFSIGRYVDVLSEINAMVLSRGSELVLLWNPIPVADQLAHLEDARALFRQFAGSEQSLFRLPPDDARLIDSGQYHDPGHYKPGLIAAVFSEPRHRVPFGQLLNELQALQNECSNEMSENLVSGE